MFAVPENKALKTTSLKESVLLDERNGNGKKFEPERSISPSVGAFDSIAMSEGARLCQLLNPLRPNSDLSQTSHCNIKSIS